ncbi:MAG: aminotransferase class I/II-fold pyridoxal phosphate-dependent enzyme [Pseudomonadota bacterium]
MQYPQRFSDLPEYAFPRLRALLGDTPPGGDLISMSIGEPTHPLPPIVAEELARHTHLYGKYPANDGIPELREAIAAWLAKRYGLTVDPGTNILPLNGTREGLFNACLALCPEEKGGARPVVLLPNPFYQCYAVAALAAGAEPIYVPADASTDYLPNFEAVPADLLERTALIYMCSPSNPQGAVASATYWRDLIGLAERLDARIFADECYSEIYRDAPPAGALEVAHQMGADPERVMIFHSLSKRSNLPGLRSGFLAGGPKSVAACKQLRNYAGAPMPLPAQHAAAAVWRDEVHVVENRALYAEKFDAADRILAGWPGYRPAQAGFFLWLPVADDEGFARAVWAEHGVRLLPGRYLARDTQARIGTGNPGAGHIRVALVAALPQIERGLTALTATLQTHPEFAP